MPHRDAYARTRHASSSSMTIGYSFMTAAGQHKHTSIFCPKDMKTWIMGMQAQNGAQKTSPKRWTYYTALSFETLNAAALRRAWGWDCHFLGRVSSGRDWSGPFWAGPGPARESKYRVWLEVRVAWVSPMSHMRHFQDQADSSCLVMVRIYDNLLQARNYGWRPSF